MMRSNRAIESAIEVFVHGHSAGKSRTFPYEVSRVGPLWLMRDAERKIARDYRVRSVDAVGATWCAEELGALMKASSYDADSYGISITMPS